MNKIFLSSVAIVGFAALFWACGDGTVSVFTQDDQLIEFAYDEDIDDDGSALAEFVNRAVSAYCSNDLNPEACLAASRPDGNTVVPSSSSEPPPRSSSSMVRSSSSFNFFASSSSRYSSVVQVRSSSSSRPAIIPIYSSSSLGLSSAIVSRSSSSAKPASSAVTSGSSKFPEDVPWGTCVANSGKPGSRGVPLKWQFSLNKDVFGGNIQVLTKGAYSWEFDSAEPSTYEQTGSSGLTSTAVTYAESGRFGARVTMSYNGQSQKVECDTAEIMGYPISKCECVPDKDEVDVAEESVASGATLVKWTVSKCESEDDSFSYEWEEGMTPGEDSVSASMTLNEKIVYSPKVTVRNADNGSMVVTCNAVNTVDSDHPEFEFKEQNVEIELPAGESTVYFNMPQNWHNGDQGNCTFSCNKIGDNPVTVTLGSNTPVTNYYVEVKVPISSTIGMTPMKLTLSGPAKCKLGW